MDERNDELRGWKEIAGYLGKSVRAAQRWEAAYGLPVHRITVPSRSAIVYARRSEIEAWKAGLDPRTLQDEEEDGPDSAPDSDAFENGNGGGLLAPVVVPDGILPSPSGTASAIRDDVAPGNHKDTTGDIGAPMVPDGREAPAPRRWWPWLVAASVTVALVLVTVMWSRAGGAEPFGTSAPAASRASDGWDRAGLDPGPWPVVGHDRRNSYQSHLVGPERPGEAKLLFDSPEDVLTYAMAAASDGTYVVGTCDGSVVILDRQGRVTRRLMLDRSFNREAPLGFGLTTNRISIAVCDCPHDEMSNARTQMTQLTTDGQPAWRFRTGAQMQPPAHAASGLWIQVDQYNTMRKLGHFGTPTWIVDLPGFSAGTPAQDAGEVIYVPTDGGTHGHRSLWAVSQDGKILWGAGTEAYSQASVSLGGDVVVYQSTHDVLGVRGSQDYVRSYTSAGGERWATPVPTSAALSGMERLAVSESGDVVVKTATGIVWLDASNGAIKRSVSFRSNSSGFEGVILDAHGNVYHSSGGQVVSLSPAGEERWAVPLEGAGRLILGHDGEVVVLVDQRKLYVIRDAARTRPPQTH